MIRRRPRNDIQLHWLGVNVKALRILRLKRIRQREHRDDNPVVDRRLRFHHPGVPGCSRKCLHCCVTDGGSWRHTKNAINIKVFISPRPDSPLYPACLLSFLSKRWQKHIRVNVKTVNLPRTSGPVKLNINGCGTVREFSLNGVVADGCIAASGKIAGVDRTLVLTEVT